MPPERLVDDRERQPSVHSSASPSIYLWAGMVAVVAAAGVGVNAALLSDSAGGATGQGMLVALAVLCGGVSLLFAESRHRFWRAAAGAPEFHPLAPDSVKRAVLRRDPIAHLDRTVLVAILALAALVRIPVQTQSFSFAEAQLLAPLLPLQDSNHSRVEQIGLSGLSLYRWLSEFVLVSVRPVFGLTAETPLPPEWVVRLPAFMFGIGAVVALFFSVREGIGRPAAFAAALLLALSPAAIDISGQATAFSAVLFFACAQYGFFARALKDADATSYIGWVSSLILGFCAHPCFMIVAAAGFLFQLFRSAWFAFTGAERRQASAQLEQALVFAVTWGAFGIAVLLSVCGMPQMSWLADPLQHSIWPAQLPVSLLSYWAGVPAGTLITVGGILAVLLSLGGVWMGSWNNLIAYCGIMLLTPIILAFIAPGVATGLDEGIFALPALLTILSGGAQGVAEWTGRPGIGGPGRELITALMSASLLASIMMPGLVEVSQNARCNLRAVVRSMRLSARSPAIVSSNEEAALGLQLYGIMSSDQSSTAGSLQRSGEVWNVSVLPVASNVRQMKQPSKGDQLFAGRFSNWQMHGYAGCANIAVRSTEVRSFQ